MAEEPENLTLQYLRRFSAQMNDMQVRMDRLIDDVGDLKRRTTGVEEAVVGLNRRLDRIEDRLDRVDRRLELHDGPPSAAE